MPVTYFINLNKKLFVPKGEWFKDCLKDISFDCRVLKLSGLSSTSLKEDAMNDFRTE